MRQTLAQSHTRTAPLNRGWTKRLFNAKAAQTGGVIRRNKRDVHREMGYAALVTEVQARGFHLLECGDQYLIICHNGTLRLIC